MMKTLVLVLAMMLVVGGACVAETATIDLYTDYNLIAAPLVPFNPEPTALFGMDGGSLDSVLSKLDAATGSDNAYSQWSPEGFGNILLGEGYWLAVGGNTTVTYDGVANGVPDGAGVKTDMWISLPGNQYDANDTDRNGDGVNDGGGWHLIGNPYQSAVERDNFFFTDGSTMKTWQEAFDAGWVSDNFQGYDGATQSSTAVVLTWGGDTAFTSARGYYIETYKDNLAMIITAPAL